MKNSNRILAIGLFCAFSLHTNAQLDTLQIDSNAYKNEHATGIFPKQFDLPLRKITISGEYRNLVTHRTMNESYRLDSTGTVMQPRELFIGDDSYLPVMMLQIGGSPVKNVTFNTDMFVYAPFNGNVTTDGNQNVLLLNLGLSLNGTYTTDVGSFSIRTGGLHWYSMTDLTFGTFTGYDRYSAFERNPWDPVDRNTIDRYKGQYEFGGITQDQRWGEQAFKGLILEGSALPGNMSFSFLYGKAQISAGISGVPDLNIGGQLKKTFSDASTLSYQTLNRITYVDSINTKEVGFNMHTLQYRKNYKGYGLNAEIGMGSYYSPVDPIDYGEAVTIKLTTPKKLTGIPLEFGYFRIHPNVINNSATFWNSSIIEVPTASVVQVSGQSNAVLQPNASSVTAVGQMTNNRQGFSINGNAQVENLKMNFGISAAKELQAVSSQISMNHPVTNLIRSRFWRWNFVSGVGPYGQENVIFRGTYDLVNVTDEAVNNAPKSFNTVEMQMRYKFMLAQRTTYVVLNSMYASVQGDLGAIPLMNDDALIRTSFAQLEFYRPLSERVVLAAVYGKEFHKGNNRTELDVVSGLPHDREGTVYGVGIDVSLGKKAGLYLRQRWFNSTDKNFALDTFKGHETMAEIKLFF